MHDFENEGQRCEPAESKPNHLSCSLCQGACPLISQQNGGGTCQMLSILVVQSRGVSEGVRCPFRSGMTCKNVQERGRSRLIVGKL